MGGSFQTDREIFNHAIWTDVVQFRLFFFLYGNARWKAEPTKIGNVEVQRGQLLRSYRNLQKDLQYIENRQIKEYPLSSLKRAIDRLVKNGRVATLETEHGTLFTVLNYAEYQGFERFNDETANGTRNGDGTAMEQSRNNKNKEKKEKKEKKSKYKYTDVHMDLARHFETSIKNNFPDYRVKNLEAWANTFRLMVEQDKRKPENIKNCIDWISNHSFWRSKCLAADNLREKYDRFMAEKADELKQRKPGSKAGRQEIVPDWLNKNENEQTKTAGDDPELAARVAKLRQQMRLAK